MTASAALEERRPAHVPEHLIVEFDYYNVARDDDDVFLAWKRLHNGPEIFWTPLNGGHWVVTRADDVGEVLTNHRDFTSIRGNAIPLRPIVAPALPVGADPPEHTEYRRLLMPFFSPKKMTEIETRVRALCRELIESFRTRGSCEFYDEFSLHMPIAVFLGIMDLPWSERDRLLPWANTAVRSTNMDELQHMHVDAWQYLKECLAQRRSSLGDDPVSALLQGEINGRKLTEVEAVGNATTLLFAGLDTVPATLSFIAHFLATHPDHRRQLFDDPALIPVAAEELLRRFPVAVLGRTLAHDLDYKGVPMKTADPILAPSVLGNLDERRFPDPLTVDFKRKDASRHLTFGNGAHRCIGSLLARTQIKVFLEEWLTRIPDFGIAPGRKPAARGGTVMAMTQLPLAW